MLGSPAPVRPLALTATSMEVSVSTFGPPPEAVQDPSSPADEPSSPGPEGQAPALAEPRTHRWGLGAFLLAEAVILGTSVLIYLPFAGGSDQPLPLVAVLLVLTVPSLLAAGVAVLATNLRGNGPIQDLRLQFKAEDIVIGASFGLGGLLLTIPAAFIWAGVVGPEQATSAVGEAFAGRTVPLPLAVAIFLAVWLLAPLCEEILFRGLLWGALERLGAGRWVAFGVTTVVFALAHLEFTRTPLLLVVAIPIGLARMVTGRLSAAIIAHQINNLLPAVGLLVMLTGGVPA